MGEAKRRKLLDPNFGKANKINFKELSVDEIKKFGLSFFPMWLLNRYSLDTDTLFGSYEYPSEDSILAEFSDDIKKYAKNLTPHTIKCSFWDFLLFASIRHDVIYPYILAFQLITGESLDNTLVCLWKTLHITSGESQYCKIIDDELPENEAIDIKFDDDNSTIFKNHIYSLLK